MQMTSVSYPTHNKRKQAIAKVLWYPLVGPTGPTGVTGLKEEPVEVSVFSSDYLLNDQQGLLVLTLSVKLTGVQYSAPALSCC